MEVEVSVEIDRPANLVWPVLVDVERWPEWTASMISVQRLDSAPFGIGSRVRIRQPKLKTMVWRVSEYEQGRSSPGRRAVRESWSLAATPSGQRSRLCRHPGRRSERLHGTTCKVVVG